MIDARLAELGIELPGAAPALANYVPFTVRNGLVFLSGQLPLRNGSLTQAGRVGRELSLEQGRMAARQCAINLLANLRLACGGSLDRVEACLKLTGFVSSGEGFVEQALVINGASDLLVEVMGDAGRHARSAVGVGILPFDAPVEVEAIFAIRDN